MSEMSDDKYINAPIRIYSALALAHAVEPDDMLLEYLHLDGCARLTVCPTCGCAEFTHTHACVTGMQIMKTADALTWLAKKGPYAR